MSDKVIWYGHSTIGLDTGKYHIIIDPYFTGNPAASAQAKDINPDYIMVTHGHGDHIGDTVPMAKRTGAEVISNAEIVSWVKKQGVENTHAQHLGGGHQYPFGYVKFTLALHGSGLPDGSSGGNPAGFLVTTNEGHKIYFAGDTGLFGDMSLIGEEGLDLAMIPIGDNFTMGPSDALRAVKLLHPKVVIPIHYNTFDLLNQDEKSWASQVEEQTGAKVVLLKPGESYTLQPEHAKV